MTEIENRNTHQINEINTINIKPPALSNLKTKLLLFSFLLLIGLILSLFTISDVDIWWHLKTGEWILKNHSLPSNDLFTYTLPQNVRWHDTQWLFQTLSAIVHHVGGWNTLIGLRVVWVFILCSGLWLWLRERKIPASYTFLSASLVIVNCRYRFGIRPELLTFSLLTFQLWLYDKSINKGKLYIVPLLLIQLLWANWHSSSVLGIFVGFAFVVNQLILNYPHRFQQPDSKKFTILCLPLTPSLSHKGRGLVLKIYLPALILVTLLNPNGWVAPLFALTESKRLSILEIQPPSFAFFIGASGLTLLLAMIGVRHFFERKSIYLAVLSFAFTIQSFQMFRFFPYLAIVSSPIQAIGIKIIADTIKAIRWKVARVVSYVFAIVIIIIAFMLNIKSDEKPLFTFGVDESKFPVSAVDFVLKENIQGHLYNEYGMGGYLVYRLTPERKVFIFPEAHLNSALVDRTMNTTDVMEWRRIFDEYQITYAITNCARGLISTKGIYTIPRIILSWADWRLVFWDDIAMVFVKDIPEYKDLIARCNCRIFPESLPYKNNPVSNIQEVETFVETQCLASLQQRQLIEKELLRVIEECPQHFRAAIALGLLRDAQGNPQGAIEAYRIAERIIPNHPELLQLFARWNLIQGNYEKAIEYINKAISNGLNKVDGLYNIAFIQYRAGRKDDALKTVNKLLKIHPKHQNGQKLYEQLTKNIN